MQAAIKFFLISLSIIFSMSASSQSIVGRWTTVKPGDTELFQFTFDENGNATFAYGTLKDFGGVSQVIVGVASGEYGFNADKSKVMLVLNHSSVQVPDMNEVDKLKYSKEIDEWKVRVSDLMLGQMVLTIAELKPSSLKLIGENGAEFNLTRHK